MRDVDRGFKTYMICQKERLKDYSSIKNLEGKRIVAGSHDSPQAYVMPINFLKKSGINLRTIELCRYDRDIGKHGDTALGEIEVLKALKNKEADVGFVSKLMWDRAVQTEHSNNHGVELAVLPFDIAGFNHCQFDSLDSLSQDIKNTFKKGLFSMTWNNESDRTIMILEGIQKEWVPPNESGYDEVREALKDEVGTDLYPEPIHTLLKHPFKSLVEK